MAKCRGKYMYLRLVCGDDDDPTLLPASEACLCLYANRVVFRTTKSQCTDNHLGNNLWDHLLSNKNYTVEIFL